MDLLRNDSNTYDVRRPTESALNERDTDSTLVEFVFISRRMLCLAVPVLVYLTQVSLNRSLVFHCAFSDF